MNRILTAFWHRTRRTFVPLMANEVARKARMTPARVAWDLQALEDDHLVQSRINKTLGSCDWQLTPLGRERAREIIAAQDMARSV